MYIDVCNSCNCGKNKSFFIFAIIILGCINKTLAHGYAYLGCYKDDPTRILPAVKLQDKKNMSNLICITYCAGNNYRFAGTQNSNQCFCGNGDKVSDDLKCSDSECVKTCKGNTAEICGGFWRLSVYKQQIVTTQSTAGTSTTFIESTSEETEQTTETTQQVLIESTSEKTEQITETTQRDLFVSTSEKIEQTTVTTQQVLIESTSEKTEQITETTQRDLIVSTSESMIKLTDKSYSEQSFETTKNIIIEPTPGSLVESNNTEDIVTGCHCPCEKISKYTDHFQTDEYIQQIVEDISIQKTTTNKYIRLKTSATDDRDSSHIIGMLGTVVIFTCIAFLIVADCVALCRMLKKV